MVNNYLESAGRLLLLFEVMGTNTGFSSIKFNISNGKFVSETTLLRGGGGSGGGGVGGGGGHLVT